MTRMELLQATLRTLTSLMVAVAVLLFLVVASAQQQAVTSLRDAKVEVSYSVARKNLSEVDGYTTDLAKAQRTLKTALDKADALQAERDDATGRYYKEIAVAREIATSIQRSGKCDRFPQGAAKSAAEDDTSLWQGINSCAAENAVPPQAAAEIKALQNPDRNPAELRDRLNRADSKLVSNAKQIEVANKEVKDLSDRIEKARASVNAMEDIRVLDSGWLVSHLALTSIPPSLMQIFLSFAGGLFGALLLTLILAVYPNNDLKFAAGEGYWNRILLGGLISVSIFVVVGGGVAVLGPRDTLSTGGSNFLAFCAIGILAGMFSDRVAKWLSDRAEIFVTPPKGRGGGGA